MFGFHRSDAHRRCGCDQIHFIGVAARSSGRLRPFVVTECAAGQPGAGRFFEAAREKALENGDKALR
jgi:hypothetical protein